MSPEVSGEAKFTDENRRRIGAFCREQSRTLSEVTIHMRRRKGGSINGVLQRMVSEELLIKGPCAGRGRSKFQYRLDPRELDNLKIAERAARRREPSTEKAPEIRSGQRILLISGTELPELASELRRLSMERHAEWIARIDGQGGRFLLGVSDDGPRCDEIESAIQRIDGIAVQARIDRFLDPEDFANWLDRASTDDGP